LPVRPFACWFLVRSFALWALDFFMTSILLATPRVCQSGPSFFRLIGLEFFRAFPFSFILNFFPTRRNPFCAPRSHRRCSCHLLIEVSRNSRFFRIPSEAHPFFDRFNLLLCRLLVLHSNFSLPRKAQFLPLDPPFHSPFFPRFFQKVSSPSPIELFASAFPCFPDFFLTEDVNLF